MEQVAYVLLFCLAVSFLLLSSNNMGQSIKLLRNSVYKQNVIREQDLDNHRIEEQLLTATRAEVIGYLTGFLEADIIINGITYSRYSFERDNFDYSTLPEGIYSKEYVLDIFVSGTNISDTNISDTNISDTNVYDVLASGADASDANTFDESIFDNTSIKAIIFTHKDK